jgi:hypothetical protein
MCLVSDKVKFCTCKSINRLKHYWIIYRFNKNKNELILGQPIFPSDLISPFYETNQATFLKRLNELDAFDTPIKFKTKDLIEIVLNSNDYENSLTYAYKYSKGKWEITEHYCYDLLSRYDEQERGKFKKI